MSDQMPDTYDRLLGLLADLPDVLKTSPSIVREIKPLGVGGSSTFVVQTVRQAEHGDTIFLEVIDATGTKRIVLPAKVANVIARQRDSLTTMSKRKGAKQAMATRVENGFVPFAGRKRA